MRKENLEREEEMGFCKRLLYDKISHTWRNSVYFQFKKVVRNLVFVSMQLQSSYRGIWNLSEYLNHYDLAINKDNNMVWRSSTTNITCLSEIKPRDKRKGTI